MSFLFVGEERSQLAKNNGWTWADGRLAAKQLFDALQTCGIDPESCFFCNLFERGGLAAIKRHSGPVVAMGRRVQTELERRGIQFIPLVHPAARGKIRRKDRYTRHVRETLTPWSP